MYIHIGEKELNALKKTFPAACTVDKPGSPESAKINRSVRCAAYIVVEAAHQESILLEGYRTERRNIPCNFDLESAKTRAALLEDQKKGEMAILEIHNLPESMLNRKKGWIKILHGEQHGLLEKEHLRRLESAPLATAPSRTLSTVSTASTGSSLYGYCEQEPALQVEVLNYIRQSIQWEEEAAAAAKALIASLQHAGLSEEAQRVDEIEKRLSSSSVQEPFLHPNSSLTQHLYGQELYRAQLDLHGLCTWPERSEHPSHVCEVGP